MPLLTSQAYIQYLDYEFDISSQVMRARQFLWNFHIGLQLAAQAVQLVHWECIKTNSSGEKISLHLCCNFCQAIRFRFDILPVWWKRQSLCLFRTFMHMLQSNRTEQVNKIYTNILKCMSCNENIGCWILFTVYHVAVINFNAFHWELIYETITT